MWSHVKGETKNEVSMFESKRVVHLFRLWILLHLIIGFCSFSRNNDDFVGDFVLRGVVRRVVAVKPTNFMNKASIVNFAAEKNSENE